MHANKSLNRNHANHRLYHVLMKALIEDENEMVREVADTVQDHKRKHDDDEDDDDEDPTADQTRSASAKEPVEEPIAEVVMNDADRLDWKNPEGDRYPFDLSKPLPLQGPQGHRTVVVDYFFNNDLEYLKTFDP
nr:hypothetical protein [Tanacetum cinerariifolium]